MTNKPKVSSFYDEEEQALIESIEAETGEFKSYLTPERAKELQKMAKATMNDEREKISLRVPRSDLVRLKSRAMQEGVPYQTLINSILHKEVSQ